MSAAFDRLWLLLVEVTGECPGWAFGMSYGSTLEHVWITAEYESRDLMRRQVGRHTVAEGAPLDALARALRYVHRTLGLPLGALPSERERGIGARGFDVLEGFAP